MAAVRQSDLEQVRRFLNEGADPSLLMGSVTAVHCGALQDNVDVMRALLAHRKAHTELINRKGETALHYACFHGNVQVQQALIAQFHCNVHARTFAGVNALALALGNGQQGQVIVNLVHAMARCPLQNSDGPPCATRVVAALASTDTNNRNALLRVAASGKVDALRTVLSLAPPLDNDAAPSDERRPTCGCTCAACAQHDCVAVARGAWRQLLVSCDATQRPHTAGIFSPLQIAAMAAKRNADDAMLQTLLSHFLERLGRTVTAQLLELRHPLSPNSATDILDKPADQIFELLVQR